MVAFDLRWMLGMAALVCCVGCKEKSRTAANAVPASGVVTLKGAPVADAQVTFAPKGRTGTSAAASTDSSGKFTLSTSAGEGAVPGEYNVAIVKTTTQGKEWSDEEVTKYMAGHGGRMPPEPAVKYEVPKQYSDPAKSGLSATVTKEGPNQFKFDLK
jgi:hypothetical protein